MSDAERPMPTGRQLWPGLAALPFTASRRFPGRIAYAKGDVTLTWDEVDRCASSMASVLAEHGIRSGDHVAILGANDPVWACAEFALWRIGAVPVLVHGGLPPATLAGQLEQADAKAVIAGPDVTGDVLRNCRARGLAEFTWGRAGGDAGAVPVDVPGPEAAAPAVPYAEAGVDDIAMLAYSSGTTGDPKGAVIRYSHVAARLLSVSLALELTAGDVGMVIGPLYMGGTQNLSVLPYAAMGLTCVFPSSTAPADVLRDIDRWGVTTFFAVPTLFSELLAAKGTGPAGGSLTRVVSAGAPLPQPLYRAFTEAFGAGLYEICGTFETGGGLAITERERKAGKPDSVGRPMPGYLVGIRGADGRAVETPFVRGEMTYGGPAVAYEYYGRGVPGEAVAEDGLFRSGDVGYFDDDGYFFIADRIKDMITSGGQNVYPAEIEAALLRLHGVRECAVIGVPHEKWGEAVHAVLVPEPGSELTADEVIAFARGCLAGFQVPKSVDFLPAIPKTSVGKVAKRELRDLVRSRSARTEQAGL